MTINFDTNISISLGELYITKDPDQVLVCYGLGSCIGISAYDPIAKVGAMAHIVLPVSNNGFGETSPAKFANTCIPLLISRMEEINAKRNRIIIKIAGGAKMIRSISKGSSLDIGERNILAVTETINSIGLKIHAQDVGGDWGRCLWLYVGSGVTKVKTAVQTIVDL